MKTCILRQVSSETLVLTCQNHQFWHRFSIKCSCNFRYRILGFICAKSVILGLPLRPTWAQNGILNFIFLQKQLQKAGAGCSPKRLLDPTFRKDAFQSDLGHHLGRLGVDFDVVVCHCWSVCLHF